MLWSSRYRRPMGPQIDMTQKDPYGGMLQPSCPKYSTKRILKTAREKLRVTSQGPQLSPVRLAADFSAETLQAGRKQNALVQVLEEQRCQPRIPSRDTLCTWMRNKDFPRQAKTEGIHCHCTGLIKDLKRILHPEAK